ncbi:MAG: terminase family protein [Xanthobacteraceae bacterium]
MKVAKHPDRAIIIASIDDAEHFIEEQKDQIIASYPAHEREARAKGNPVLGSGRVFPVAEEKIAIPHRTFPAHFARIAGIDFGFTHPTAAVEVWHDRDADVVYVTKSHRLKEASVIQHAATLRGWGDLRFAWPRDGLRGTLEGAGAPLAQQFRDQGLDLLPEHAAFADRSVSVEAGCMEMLMRMESGRFKVFDHLHDWFSEFRLFHRQEGKIVPEYDDLISATRYAVVMLRYASTKSFNDKWRREIDYPRTRYA